MQRWFVRAHLAVVRFHDRLMDERGATAVEYALMVALIAGVIVISVGALGKATNGAFPKVKFP